MEEGVCFVDKDSKSKKIVVAGAGQMAGYYVGPMVNELGIDPADLTVVDISQSALDAFGKKFPGIRLTTSLEEALEGGAGMLLNLVNSPSHLPILKAAVAAEVPYVYSEKPIVPSSDLDELLELKMGDTTVVTAYVINYSSAVARLVELMREYGLYVQKAVVEWGKERYGNSRATAGTVEDEACHGVRLMTYLLSVMETWSLSDDVYVRASVLHEPYVDDAVQQAAMAVDSSFVAEPPSLVQLHALYDITDSNEYAHLLLRSNFTRAENEREVILTLGDKESRKPVFKAVLKFDLPTEQKGVSKDTLQFGRVGKPMESTEFRTNKLSDMMRSFLAYTQGEPLDGRLSALKEAIHDVFFATAVLESDSQQGREVHVEEFPE